MKKADVVRNDIHGDLAIVGLSSTGQASFESHANSGIGSNGLTSARHDMLSHYYAEKYPETFDPNVASDLVYCGPYKLEDALPNSNLTVGDAILSPTRSYAPVIYKALSELGTEVKGLIHCSGGAQTKCMKFGTKVHFVKDNLFSTPPLFEAIQNASDTSWEEMYKVFNMGHRMEVYVPFERVQEVIDIAASYQIEAQQIGYTETADKTNLTLTSPTGNIFQYG